MRAWVFFITFFMSGASAFAQVDFKCAQGQVSPESIKGMQAVRALYRCQQSSKFANCDALSGYVAGRTLSPAQKRRAERMLNTKNRIQMGDLPTNSDFDIVMMMMDIGAIATGGIGLKVGRVVSNHIPFVAYGGCATPQDEFINSRPTMTTCKADIKSADSRVVNFVNGNPATWEKGLKLASVCRHYENRLKDLVKSSYKNLSCTSSSAVSETTDGKVRTLYFDQEGSVSKVKILDRRTSHDTEVVIDPMSSVMKTVETYAGKGNGRAKISAHDLKSGHPFYEQIARVRLEAGEISACCLSKKPECQAELSGTAPSIGKPQVAQRAAGQR